MPLGSILCGGWATRWPETYGLEVRDVLHQQGICPSTGSQPLMCEAWLKVLVLMSRCATK